MIFEIEAQIIGTRMVKLEADNAEHALKRFWANDYSDYLNDDTYAIDNVLSITEVTDNEATV